DTVLPDVYLAGRIRDPVDLLHAEIFSVSIDCGSNPTEPSQPCSSRTSSAAFLRVCRFWEPYSTDACELTQNIQKFTPGPLRICALRRCPVNPHSGDRSTSGFKRRIQERRSGQA